MAAAAADPALLDLIPQIHALFADPLRVLGFAFRLRCNLGLLGFVLAINVHIAISYKWLSRNFSVSSNDSKRLLQEFVNKHGADLKVIYSVSGWLKKNPTNYCVKLTSGHKLEEARQEFKDSCSVQVYSIQACIPKDTAVLWNPEFVQAEELFNRPFDEENCLRDNRFCGVLNSFVKRTANGKLVSSLPPKPINSVAAAAPLKTSSAPKEQSAKGQQQGLPGSSSPKKGTSNKAEKDISSVLDKATNAPVVKESSIALQGNKNKAQNGKALPSNGGSLATMWGRASAKPKTPATTNPTVLPSVAVTADAQICAKEEANADSSDDEQAVHYKRGSSANNRKRRAVFDLSDDDEDDNVVAIASPEPPEQCITNPIDEVAQESNPKQENLENKQEVEKDVKCCIGRTESPECKTKSSNTVSHSGITLKEKNNGPPPNDNKQDHAAETASNSPKRRKVLKTRIDERGREVTEVVWEGEASAGDKAEKNVSDTGAANRATLSSKPQPVAKTEKSNASSKTAGNKKPAKAGTKQGNIMSFFKKMLLDEYGNGMACEVCTVGCMAVCIQAPVRPCLCHFAVWSDSAALWSPTSKADEYNQQKYDLAVSYLIFSPLKVRSACTLRVLQDKLCQHDSV
uniref:DNA polymerase delta subunit 3 n=1 Tax=Oryza barthii TaxID=65489 RepID=A0A0D3EKV1_9ORYZ